MPSLLSSGLLLSLNANFFVFSQSILRLAMCWSARDNQTWNMQEIQCNNNTAWITKHSPNLPSNLDLIVFIFYLLNSHYESWKLKCNKTFLFESVYLAQLSHFTKRERDDKKIKLWAWINELNKAYLFVYRLVGKIVWVCV